MEGLLGIDGLAFLHLFDLFGVGEEAALGLGNLLQVLGAACHGGAVFQQAVLLDDELPLAVPGLFQRAAGAALFLEG